MENKGLTLTMIFAAESANYGEGFGNLTVLKKMTRSDANQYTYISRQAMRYSIVQQMGADGTPVSDDKGVVQFSPEATIADYPEIDFFGYMKTMSKEQDAEGKGGAKTRSAVARLSNAVALESYKGDLDFLTNMGLAKRGNFANAIAQSEINAAYYCYTISIDLDRVGVDDNGSIEISVVDRCKRVNDLLDTLEYLYRDIKGRRENLAPLFVVGGVYGRKNPFFENRVKVHHNHLLIAPLAELIDSNDTIKDSTHVGVAAEIFDNHAEIVSSLDAVSIAAAFDAVKKEVSDYYA